jgi:predicted transcriptional regulator
MSDVLSVRVAKELKRRADELGINIREVVENALERAIEEREREELKGLANKIKELMRDVREEDWLNDVKGSRNER